MTILGSIIMIGCVPVPMLAGLGCTDIPGTDWMMR